VLTVHTPEAAVRFSPEIEQAVYRVAQEALENVARHAGARHITVALDAAPSDLVLTVADDGRGFDPGRVSPNGLGLKGIRERAEMLGGRMEIDSREGGPTTLRLRVPS
jgi:signal transduction histidine kinase